MNQTLGLLFTLALGLFIIIGAAIVFLSKNSEKFVHFSMSLAFGVMLTLLAIDLIPESYEHLSPNRNLIEILILIFGFALLGFLLLKILDAFIPDHDDHPNTKTDDNKNLTHIGVVSSIALILHNIIEGMAIYTTMVHSPKSGLLMSIGVGLHNIPLGIAITSAFYRSNQNKKKTFLYISLVSISTFLGGLGMFFLNAFINDLLLGILLSLTSGMLIYICFMELLPKIFVSKDKKTSIIGTFIGIVLLLLTLFL